MRAREASPASQGKLEHLAHRGRSIPIRLNAILNAWGNVAQAGVVALVTPVALHFLGEVAWGIWQIVGAATAYALLLNLGIGSAVSYHVSRSIGTGDDERLSASLHS